MQKDIKYWLALASNGQIGAKTFAKLLARFNSMEEVWCASIKKLKNMQIPDNVIKLVLEIKSNTNPDAELNKINKLGIKVVTIKDENYPKLLKQIPDAPAVLYYKGEFCDSDEFSVAVVGSRKYSDYGRRTTIDITEKLANEGITIISGLALGIDSFAHQATLKMKKRTIGVLANGLDTIYPLSNQGLARLVLNNNGAIVSEFPPGMPALKHNFPVRNRIIAGLSLGTLVVEGELKSGSLITAQCALDYNREVFAVPGSIYSSVSDGPNFLIKSGAKLVTSYNDILEELNFDVKMRISEAKKIIPDSREEAIILKFVNYDNPIHIDKLIKLTKLDIITLSSKLSLMEIKGKIKNIGASNYLLGH